MFTVSFGLASSVQGADFEQVVSVAEVPTSSAKAGGRDRIVISAGPDLPAVVGGFWDPAMPTVDDPISGPLRESQHH